MDFNYYERIEDVKDLIFKGMTEDASKLLNILTRKGAHLRQINDTIILRTNQLKETTSFFHKGIMRYDDYMVAKANIINSFLYVCSELQDIEEYMSRYSRNDSDQKGLNNMVNNRSNEQIRKYVEELKNNEEKLLKSNTHVFVFGKEGVGKTSLINSIAVNMFSNYNLSGGNNQNNLLSKPRTGEISKIETTFHLTNTNTMQPIPFTFVDMSGEDLSKMDILKPKQTPQYMSEKIEELLSNSKYFLFTTSYNEAKQDDILFRMMINFLIDKNIDLNKIGIVVTKWDLNNKNNKAQNMEAFGNIQLPLTTNKLIQDSGKINIFRHSNLENTVEDNKKILNWIL